MGTAASRAVWPIRFVVSGQRCPARIPVSDTRSVKFGKRLPKWSPPELICAIPQWGPGGNCAGHQVTGQVCRRPRHPRSVQGPTSTTRVGRSQLRTAADVWTAASAKLTLTPALKKSARSTPGTRHPAWPVLS